MATVYIDPTFGSNGAGTFADPRNTWVGITWTASDLYLQKESTLWAGSASISPSQNNIVFGTYDAVSGLQVQDNTRHAKIANTSGQGINCNSRTGLVIDNLEITGNSASGNAIQALYTNSGTALNLTVRRCRLFNLSAGGGAPLRARGDGLIVEDTIAHSDASAAAAFPLTCINVTIKRCTISSSVNSAVSIASTADNATTAVNVLVEDCTLNTTGTVAGDALLVKGNNVTIRRVVSTSAADNSLILRCQNLLIENCHFSGFDLNRSTGDGVQLVGTHDVLDCTIRNVIVIGHLDSPVKQCFILGDSEASAQSGNVLIENCYSYGMALGIIMNIPGGVVRRCRVYGTGGGIVASASDVKVLDNLIYTISVRGIGVDGVFTGIEITGNSVIDVLGSGIGTGPGTATIKNNLVICGVGGTNQAIREETGTCTLNNNRYFARSGSLSWLWNSVSQTTIAAWKTASSQDAASSEGDPLLTSDYKPTATSPLVAAGTHLGYRRDIEGKQRQNPPCIGAYDAAPMRAPLA